MIRMSIMLATADPSRYQKRVVTRGTRKGQQGWYDSVAKKFMPASWEPRKPAPEKPVGKPKTAAKTAQPTKPPPPPKVQPTPPTPPAPQPSKQQAAPKPTPAIHPQAAAHLERLKAAAQAELSDPNHPVIKHRDRLQNAKFGSGMVRTLQSTQDRPLSAADHGAMDKLHSRTAAALKLVGNEQGAKAQLEAAMYHRNLAQRKSAPPPPAAPTLPPVTPEKFKPKEQLAQEPAKEPKRLSKPEDSEVFNSWVSGEHADKEIAIWGEKNKSDEMLAHLNKEIGYDAPPELLTEEEMDKRVASGAEEMFRGVSGGAAQADQFRKGELFVGVGAAGSGTYLATKNSAKEGGYNYALSFTKKKGDGKGDPNGVMRMTIKEDAKIARGEELSKLKAEQQKTVSELLKARDQETDPAKKKVLHRKAAILSDMGRYATLSGYDAFEEGEGLGSGHIVLLNRGASVVQATPAQPPKK